MEFLTDKKVKTRKSHVCHGCASSYPAKTEMRYVTSKDGGEISSAYWCKTCEEIMDKTWDYTDREDGVEFGMVRDGDIPFWESIHLKYQVPQHEEHAEPDGAQQKTR